ncbi:hypothetical protein BDR05DRAFT_759589 [Suillus weaverae]|nr:hypothetical protein BDR05DRAFT_759589 [Suillus weaverae]
MIIRQSLLANNEKNSVQPQHTPPAIRGCTMIVLGPSANHFQAYILWFSRALVCMCVVNLSYVYILNSLIGSLCTWTS